MRQSPQGHSRSIANLRIDAPSKAGALIAAGLFHGAVIFFLTTGVIPPRLPEVGLVNFEIVNIPNDVEQAEQTPAPKPEVSEPEPPIEEPVLEEPQAVEEVVPPEPEVPEPEPVVESEPDPIAETVPERIIPKFDQPKRKPTPPPRKIVKAKPVSKPAIQKKQAQPVDRAQQKPSVAQSAYVPPSSSSTRFSNPKPLYPLVARRRGMEGRVLLVVSVSGAGGVMEVTVKESSGYEILDKAALKTVRKWRFTPATRGGRSVAASLVVPIRFNLRDL